MNIWSLRLMALWLSVAINLVAVPESHARPSVEKPSCHAVSTENRSAPARAVRLEGWVCSGRAWSIAGPSSFLHFDMHGAEWAPRFFVTRLTRFDMMRVTVIGSSGSIASRDLTEDDMTPSTGDWMMAAALPQSAEPVDSVLVRIDGARHVGMLSDARLALELDVSSGTYRHELLIAVLCGMLIMPLLFNFAFFRVLRERFLLWHALSTLCMLAHTVITSGLINRFSGLSIDELSILSSTTVGGGVIAASLFAADLIEPSKLAPLHRRLLRCTGLWVAPWTLFYLFADGPLRPYTAPLYLSSFLLPIGLYIWVMAVAKRRGSRAVSFQIAAWLPVMLTAIVRIASSLGATDAPVEALVAQHYALGLEVIITSLGVFDRLLAIRRERDVALADLRVFEEHAQRDPLTGLLNRRAIEARFKQLQASGFRTMAVIDLDKFKQINDNHGHVVGDAVLRAAAEALEPSADTLAIRLGGEEFLLLLRGKNGMARAERRRRAISARVAAQVSGLDRIVTASMGLVEQPPDSVLYPDFDTLYAHCDRLLYEAKHAGRNRTMSEKMQSFRRAERSSMAA